MRDYAWTGDGFIRYADITGHGLANQGWKDSKDAVQFADGTLAEAPIALCEVQAYALCGRRYAARDLLDAFGRPGGERWRDWAARLASASGPRSGSATHGRVSRRSRWTPTAGRRTR